MNRSQSKGSDFWTQTLGLNLSVYRIDYIYPKLIQNEE